MARCRQDLNDPPTPVGGIPVFSQGVNDPAAADGICDQRSGSLAHWSLPANRIRQGRCINAVFHNAGPLNQTEAEYISAESSATGCSTGKVVCGISS